VSAAPIASDSFTDANNDNELNGDAGGSGWAGAWTAAETGRLR